MCVVFVLLSRRLFKSNQAVHLHHFKPLVMRKLETNGGCVVLCCVVLCCKCSLEDTTTHSDRMSVCVCVDVSGGLSNWGPSGGGSGVDDVLSAR